MKSYITAAAVFSILLLSIPAVPIMFGKTTIDVQTKNSSQTMASEPNENDIKDTDNKSENRYKNLKVLDVTTGKVNEISGFDYVVGVVCAEMPATFESEALKAQAVAAYTYAERQINKSKLSPDVSLCGAYFSNDSSEYQSYFNENQAKQYYGKNYDEYISKIKKAVSEVEGEYLTYEGEPIIAAFHSLSTGKTECAENVWGNDIPYLISVESKYDSKSPNFTECYEFSKDEMQNILENSFNNIKLSENPQDWFTEKEISDAENIMTIKIGNITATGQEIMNILSLRSASFKIEYDDIFKITVKGCGHCVGMSQYGANEMAKTGMNYKEILEHYYPKTTIIK